MGRPAAFRKTPPACHGFHAGTERQVEETSHEGGIADVGECGQRPLSISLGARVLDLGDEPLVNRSAAALDGKRQNEIAEVGIEGLRWMLQPLERARLCPRGDRIVTGEPQGRQHESLRCDRVLVVPGAIGHSLAIEPTARRCFGSLTGHASRDEGSKGLVGVVLDERVGSFQDLDLWTEYLGAAFAVERLQETQHGCRVELVPRDRSPCVAKNSHSGVRRKLSHEGLHLLELLLGDPVPVVPRKTWIGVDPS